MIAIRERGKTVSEWDVRTQCPDCGKTFRLVYYSLKQEDELPKFCPLCGGRLEDPEQ